MSIHATPTIPQGPTPRRPTRTRRPATDPYARQAGDAPPVVIVGTGPAGLRTAREILRAGPAHPLVLYGNEPWQPYDRVRLSSLLAGDAPWHSLLTPLAAPSGSVVEQRYNCPVVGIDRPRQLVMDATGACQAYSALVLATGSRPHVPSIPGIGLPGVYTFRNLDDVQRLVARRTRSRRTLVLGGGLLGLEAARAMQRLNTEVVLVHHASRLMNRQLDEGAAALLRLQVETLGIEIIAGDGVARILGQSAVTAVELHSGTSVRCDTIVVATGIAPNVDLALGSGLAIGRGIKVDDALQTSDPRIFAVGECAEHRGRVYGLVGPGLEQAAVVADRIRGGSARYYGSLSASHLKVAGFTVLTIGETGDNETSLETRRVVHREPKDGHYRSVLLRRGRPVGALAIGDWPESGRLQDTIVRRRRLWPWQLRRFARDGVLWRSDTQAGVAAWPAHAVVCNCAGVTRGDIARAIAQGHRTLVEIQSATGASSVCGACRARVAELSGNGVAAAPFAWRPLLGVSLLALAGAAAAAFVPPMSVPGSVQGGLHPATLWLDGFWKQVTGFTLAGLSALLLLVSARKRWRLFTWGSFAAWRLGHGALGTALLLLLAAHTGLRLGAHLDFLLGVTFLALAATGAAAGTAGALEAHIGGRRGVALRTWWNRTHLWLFWVFPLLLGFHVLKVYYF